MDLEFLVKNGVQFGHQSWRVNPKMMPYIWGEKNGVHLIDVSKTATHIEKAAQFLEGVAARGEPILWVGTKKAAQPVIEQAAQQLESPYVANRWIGGTLTNYSEVKKAILKLKHYESLLEHSEKQYTKKEYGRFRKVVDRVEENVGGIRNISWPIGALVVVDAKKEHVAVKEAEKAGVPVVALTDTNTDPSGVDYIIPGNDDISRAVRVVIDPLVEAVARGQQKAEKAAAEQKKAEQEAKQQKASTQDKQEEHQQEASEQAVQEEAAAPEEQQKAEQASEQEAEQKADQKAESTAKSKQTEKASSASSQTKSTAKKTQTTKSASGTTTQRKTSQQKQAQTQSDQSKTSSTSKQSTTKTTASSSSQTKSKQQKDTTSTKSSAKSSAKSTAAEQKQSEATGEEEPIASDNQETTE